MSYRHHLELPTAIVGLGDLDRDEILLHFNLHVRLDEIVDVGAEPSVPKDLGHLAYKIYQERRLRNRIVGAKLFGEPAWDMLLALYCLPARGDTLTVTGLTYAAEVPQATGIRWQRTLSGLGLIERAPGGADARKKQVRLTQSGRDLMERILTRLSTFEAKVPINLEEGGHRANGALASIHVGSSRAQKVA